MTEFNNILTNTKDIIFQVRKNVDAIQKWNSDNLKNIYSPENIIDKVNEELNYLLYHSFTNISTKVIPSIEKAFAPRNKDYNYTYDSIISNKTDGIHKPRRSDFRYFEVLCIENDVIYESDEKCRNSDITNKKLNDYKKEVNYHTYHDISKLPWLDGRKEMYLNFIKEFNKLDLDLDYRTYSVTRTFENKKYVLSFGHHDDEFMLYDDKEKELLDSTNLFLDDISFHNLNVCSSIETKDKEVDKYFNDVIKLENVLLFFNDEILKIKQHYENLYKQIYEVTQQYRVLDELKNKK